MDDLCCLFLVFVMLSRLFIATLWSPVGKRLTSWLLFVMFNCVMSLSHVVSWVRCSTSSYRFLIFAAFVTLVMAQAIKWLIILSYQLEPSYQVLNFSIYICYNLFKLIPGVWLLKKFWGSLSRCSGLA